MEQTANKLSKEVIHQLPSFVRENYDTFIAFLQAYYEFMELSGNAQDVIRNAKSYLDIDTTLDEFVDYFLNQYAYTIPRAIFDSSTTDSKRLFVKYASNLYKSKGSEAAFRLMFRLLYDEEIEFYYPNQYLFKPSSGLWTTEISVKTSMVSGIDPSTLNGVLIRGKTSNVAAVVDRILKYDEGPTTVYEVFLDKDTVTDEFIGGEQLVIGDNVSVVTALNVLSRIDVVDGGKGHLVSDQVLLTGAGSTFATIDRVGYDGSVKGVSVKIFSVDSTSNVTVSLSNPPKIINGTYEVTDNVATLALTDKHYLYPGDSAEFTFLSGGATSESGTHTVKTTIGLRALQFQLETSNTTGNVSVEYHNTSNLIARTGTLCFYGGTYGQTFQGQTDHEIRLQDSEYYQQFSYVIRSNLGIDQWRDVIKSVLHPAGFALFGELFVQNDVGEESIFVGATDTYDTYVEFLQLLISGSVAIDASIPNNTYQFQLITSEPKIDIYSSPVVIGPTRQTLDKFKWQYDESTPVSEVLDLQIQFFTEPPNQNKSWNRTPPSYVRLESV